MFFGSEIRQLGFVVNDLDAALDHWVCHIGAGPFYRADVIEPDDFEHRGHPQSPRFAAALGNSGPIQIELVQPIDAVPTLWREFLDEGREGLQHVAYWTHEFDRDYALAADTGLKMAHRGVLTGGRFAYFESPIPGGYAIELSEQSPAKERIFGGIREAAARWDGTDPVRPWSDVARLAEQA